MITHNLLDKKVGFISLGCDKNRVDLENMIFKIKSAGFSIVNDMESAEIIIVNTCSFLESSRMEAIQNILEVSELKDKNLEKVIVTGCLNELGISDLHSSLPEVDRFVRIEDNENIVNIIYSLYNQEFNDTYPTGRVLTTPNHYAYLKISEGCNNFCSYCLIPYIRGRYKSRAIESIIDEAKHLVESGVRELIIVAQDVTKYGVDLYKEKKLVELLRELSKIESLDWIRLLYCYPEEIDDELIDEIANNKKIIKYLDIPLQHVSDNILNAMNRRSSKDKIYKLFNTLKNKIKGIVLRTTFILGFPNETENDFNQILEFLKEFRINNVGFFKYSREEGTRAFDFDNQIDENIKDDRLEIAYQTQYEIQLDILNNYLGKTLDVYIDEVFDQYSIGRFYGQCPLIDGVVQINEKLQVGEKYPIKIIDKIDYDLIGERL